MTATKPARRAPAGQVDTRQQITEQFVALVNQVPEAAAGDITDLLGPIMAAASWEELRNSEEVPSSKSLAARGDKIRVDSIARKVSDKTSITGYYLMCDGVNIDTGDVLRFTAGGSQAVAVLSKLYTLRQLPAYVQFVEVPLADGNTAVNCKVLGVDPSRIVDA